MDIVNRPVLDIPQDTEAEQAVLGAIIFNNDIISDIAGVLEPKSFHSESHQHIFRAMLDLVEKNQPIDEILIADQLKSFGKLEEIGGILYLAELIECCPSDGNIVYYAQIIGEHAIARELITTTNVISRKSRDPQQNLPALLAEADEKINEIALKLSDKSGSHIKDILCESFAKLEEISERKSDITGLPTGFVDLDKITAGLNEPDLIIVAARPSMGKGNCVEEPILMADGSWKKNKNLKVGDYIASVDGFPNQVAGVFPKGKIDFYRVTFKDGRTVDCDLDHRWTIASSKWSHKRRTVDIIKLKELITERIRYKGRIYTEPIQGHFGCYHNLGIDPWVLGALLGDGCFRKTCLHFSNSEPYMVDKMSERFSGKVTKVDGSKKVDYRLTFNRKISSELQFIRDSGLDGKKSPEKYVPEIIFKSSKNIREQVLAGLIETDGWVEKKGSLFFGSSSEQLRDDVVNLVRSIGGSAKPSIKKNRFYTYKGEKLKGLDAHQCVIRLPDPSFLKSPRILNRLKQRHMAYPIITNVEYIGKKKSQCISVSHKSELYCVGGYIMTHNTAFALNIATYVSKWKEKKGAVQFFSMEMSKQQLAMRMLSSEARIDSKKLRTGKLEQEDWDKLAMATDKISDFPFHINDTPNMSPYEVATACKRLDKELEDGVSLVVVDYLQLMRGNKKTNNREQEIAEISRSMKNLAKDMGIPVIVLSQLNRALENRSDKHPQLSDLRESGSIEQDADIILFIYRDEVYDNDSALKGIAEIVIAKHRNGPTGAVNLAFIGKYTRFANLAMSEMPVIEPKKKKRNQTKN